MVFGGGDLWVVIRSFNPSWIGLVPLKESQESLFPLSTVFHMRIQVSSLQIKRGLSSEFNYIGTLILDFQPRKYKKWISVVYKPHLWWIKIFHLSNSGYPGSTVVKNLPANAKAAKDIQRSKIKKKKRFHPWIGKIPWRRKWQSTAVFSPGKFHE